MRVLDTAEKAAAFFTEDNSVEAVIERISPAADLRLAFVMRAAIRHLHAFVKEVEPTEKEWALAIDFLTRTGQMCDTWRQEYILLSDVLGVSMLVDAINNRKPSGATQTTVLGPFHIADAPRRALGANICLDGKGEPLRVEGYVRDVDGRPISNALLDVWQTNDEGFYDVQQKGVQPEMNLRGVFETDAAGRYWFQSAKPRFYPIPNDGPVGQLLRAMGRHPNRPAHIHFIVSATGYAPITTHLFAPDSPYLTSDPVFGVKASLIGRFERVADQGQATAAAMPSPFWRLEHDFVLTR
jgi:protocatechuate 3,4-dioxygenase beta subunit